MADPVEPLPPTTLTFTPPVSAPTVADASSEGLPMPPGVTDQGYLADLSGAMIGGAANAAFETKDFLTGGPPEEKSGIRDWFEQGTEAATKDSLINSAASGIAQFATGMLGVGKLTAAARMLPAVEAGAAALGETTVAAGKAALAQTSAFDPHQARLSNLIQNNPILGDALSNPITGWLAASPDDGRALAYTKTALESVGIDATLVGAFLGGLKVYKAIHTGAPAEEVAAATDELAAVHNPMAGAALSFGEPHVTETPNLLHYPILQDGGEVGHARIQVSGPEAYVDWIEANGEAGSLGPGAVRTLAKQFFEEHPEVQTLTGERITGARQASGSEGMASITREQVLGPTPAERPVEPPVAGEPSVATESATPTPAAPTAPVEAPLPPTTLTLDTTAETAGHTPKIRPTITIDADTANSLISSMRSDTEAIDEAGSVQGAIENGHVFAQGEGIPWNKLTLPGEVDDFMAQIADHMGMELDEAKGGAVLTDERLMQQVRGIASYFEQDPATIIGRIQTSGQAATKMVADMETAYLLANRMLHDSFALATRIGLEDFTGFVSREAAVAEFQRQATIAASLYANGRSIQAAAGRATRRGAFALDPTILDSINTLGGEKLINIFRNTAGDPLQLRMAAQPSFLHKAAQELGVIVQSNLLWGYGTHIVNVLSNGYMIMARPLQRIVGGTIQQLAGDATGAATREQAVKQLSYYASSWVDGLQSVWNAMKNGQGVLSQRHTGLAGEMQRTDPSAKFPWSQGFEPWTSPTGILSNAYYGGLRPLLVSPLNAIVAADEMMKQTVYRSVVASRAAMEADNLGMSGDALGSYVQGKLAASMDASGAALDQGALQEAKTVTFAQPLLPDTAGAAISNFVQKHPLMRLVLPFTHTPTNIFRETVKGTPLVNLAQAEYRDMLMGKQGPEQQAQAMGQMALGSVIMPAIAYAGLNLTGGGPQDPMVRAQLMATGWRPYSLVVQWGEKRLYLPIGRMDPIAFPFGIVADIHDYLNTGADATKVQASINALTFGVMKQIQEKTYLQTIAAAAKAFSGDINDFSKFAEKLGAEMIPASSAFRNYTPDPYLREARTAMDHLRAITPGLGSTLPPRYDALGQPIYSRVNFIGTQPNDPTEGEIMRMTMQGYTIPPLAPTVGAGQTDLRDVTMADGKSAWQVYQELSGQPRPDMPSLKDAVGKIMAEPFYQKLPDGPDKVEGTRLWALQGPVAQYRHAALLEIQKDKNVRDAMLSTQLRVANAVKGNTPAAQASDAMSTLKTIGAAFGQNLANMPSFGVPPSQ